VEGGAAAAGDVAGQEFSFALPGGRRSSIAAAAAASQLYANAPTAPVFTPVMNCSCCWHHC
jgi:hypothetical protein